MTKQEITAGVFILVAFSYISGYASFELTRGARVAYDTLQGNKTMVAEK